MDLDSAIGAHGEWKVKLRHAIARKEKVDVATIAADHQCALGKWLHGEARSKYGTLKSYTNCVHKHAEFHREAGKVAAAINAEQYSQAEAMLAGGTAYAAASSAIGGAVLGLRKEAAI